MCFASQNVCMKELLLGPIRFLKRMGGTPLSVQLLPTVRSAFWLGPGADLELQDATPTSSHPPTRKLPIKTGSPGSSKIRNTLPWRADSGSTMRKVFLLFRKQKIAITPCLHSTYCKIRPKWVQNQVLSFSAGELNLCLSCYICETRRKT